MKKEKVEIINQIIDELETEKRNVQKSLNRNLDRISEISLYLRSLLDKEDCDFKVFSPRNVESVYHEQISGSNEEQSNLESENIKFYREINRIDSMIDKMRLLLEDEEVDSETLVCNENIKDTFSRETLVEIDEEEYASLDIQENERQRIARDLHDTSLQNLTGLVHKTELASMFVTQDPTRAKLELATTVKALRETIEEIRNTVYDLRPMTFDDLGFKELLQSFIEKKSENKDFEIIIDECEIHTKKDILLLTIFRIIRECILNSIKHSGCSEIRISLKEENHNIHIMLEDNGCGFDYKEKIMKNDKHFGLLIMKERVQLLKGKLNFKSTPNEGTHIEIDVPVNDDGGIS